MTHKCQKVFEYPTHNDRSIWMGEIIEGGHPGEEFCIHIVTPHQDVVLEVNHTDAGWLAIFAHLLNGKHINQHWVDRMLMRMGLGEILESESE